MQQNYVKEQKIIKIVQLVILVIIELTFILLLLFKPELRTRIYSNFALLTVCTVTWILMIFSLLCLFLDFYRLKSLAIAKHALNKVAYLDTLTGIPNRYSCDLIFQSYADGNNMEQVGCAMIQLANLKAINEALGHSVGDGMLQDFSNLFEKIGDKYGFVARNGGNEFIIVINDCTDKKMGTFTEELSKCVSDYNHLHDYAPIEIDQAYVLNSEMHAERINELITMAYEKLHNIVR